MRKLNLLSLLFILLLMSCETAPVPASDEEATVPTAAEAEAAIQKLVSDAFDEVWSNLDTTALARLHTDDFVLLEHGEVWTNDTILNYQRNAMIRKEEEGYERINRFEFLQTEADENSVWTSYHNYGTWKKGEEVLSEAHWLESAVAVYTEEGWKLRMLHSTRVQH